MKKTIVFIADDHPLVREAIKNNFRANSEIDFYGEADNGTELIALIEKSIPHIAIIDLEMPGMNGYDTIFELHCNYPQIKTIAFSGFLDVPNQKRAIELGAVATICKTEPPNIFKKAIQAVIAGKSFHSNVSSYPCSDDASSDDTCSDSLNDDKYHLLTIREKQILDLIAKGKTSQQISTVYGISKWTVDKHRSNIKEKLEIKNLAELIRYAIGKNEFQNPLDIVY